MNESTIILFRQLEDEDLDLKRQNVIFIYIYYIYVYIYVEDNNNHMYHVLQKWYSKTWLFWWSFQTAVINYFIWK